LRTDHRILVTMFLILAVMVGTNLLFPPIEPEPVELAEGAEVDSVGDGQGVQAETTDGVGQTEMDTAASTVPVDAPTVEVAPQSAATGETFVVSTPLYNAVLSTRGAVMESFQLNDFRSFSMEGAVELVPTGFPVLGNRIILRSDTLDTRSLLFDAGTRGARDIAISEGSGAEAVTLRYTHPTQPFLFELTYTFSPDSYVIGVEGRVAGLGDAVLLTDLGAGIPINETRAQDDRQVFAFVSKNTRSGIDAERLSKVEERALVEGPLDWVAFKSKYFVTAAMAATEGGPERSFGGAVIGEHIAEDQLSATFGQAFTSNGEFEYRMYMGPQDRALLVALGADLENVNPYGWAFMRPIIKPFTGIITGFLIWMHTNFNLAYGWVLMIFGVLMRVLMFPLYQKSMRAQMKNMAVQPRLKEIQTKYKDKPELLQAEMMKLYKEEGFNPLAGCLPMLLPWPVLVALFFVFQNTIELRGVPFLWLPDLSAPDPLYILPLLMGISMFLLQFISVRSIPDANPQMKMMMWIFPVVFMVMFANFASGLNLYYAVGNTAMLPQQWWIAKERKATTAKMKAKSDAENASGSGSDGSKSGESKSGGSKPPDSGGAPDAGDSSGGKEQSAGSAARSRRARNKKRKRGGGSA
jgi:YidC/Oxa1 family membrane protein insertase